MPAQKVTVIDNRKANAANSLLPTPFILSGSGWSDLHLEVYQQPKFEIAEHQHTMHVIAYSPLRDREGIDRRSAILRAAPQRLRAILMTTITTVLGMFPLALGLGQGGEFLQPLGIVVFSGLSLATLLTLFIIPCFYVVLHDLTGGMSQGRKRSHKGIERFRAIGQRL
jgi:hypothetical protein